MKHCTVLLLLVLFGDIEAKKNILHFIIDDLRPELPTYQNNKFYPGSNNDVIQAPNIAELAKRSTVFSRAYGQYPLCTPSRSSFLTGKRPLSTGVLSNMKYFRDYNKHIVTMPEYFKRNDYASLGTGKVFHPMGDEDKISFDEFHDPDKKLHAHYSHIGDTWMKVADDEDVRVQLPDEHTRDQAVTMLQKFVNGDYEKSNFYMAVGFMKPHIPWVAPERFFDLYDLDKVLLPENKRAPEDLPFVSWPHAKSCILDCADSASISRITGLYNLTVPDDLAAKYQRGYYACISYVDSLVGEVLAALRELNLENDTIILLHSDHGYNLGENSAWGKRTQFETANHVPLMFHYPGIEEGKTSSGFAELVDLFPTLVDLAELPTSDVPRCSKKRATKENLCHEGVSLAPVIRGEMENSANKAAYFLQYHHVKHPVRGWFLGETVLTEEGRYTKWLSKTFSKRHQLISHNRKVLFEELYDHANDVKETRNVVHKSEHKMLHKRLRRYLKKS